VRAWTCVDRSRVVAGTAPPGSRRARPTAIISAPAARVFASARPQHQRLLPLRPPTRSRRSAATPSDLSTKSAATIALPSCMNSPRTSLPPPHPLSSSSVLRTRGHSSERTIMIMNCSSNSWYSRGGEGGREGRTRLNADSIMLLIAVTCVCAVVDTRPV